VVSKPPKRLPGKRTDKKDGTPKEADVAMPKQADVSKPQIDRGMKKALNQPDDKGDENIESIKDQLLWSQKQELEVLRRDFQNQKKVLVVQQQRIHELESQIMHVLLAANKRIFLQDPSQPEPVANTLDSRLEDEDDEDANVGDDRTEDTAMKE